MVTGRRRAGGLALPLAAALSLSALPAVAWAGPPADACAPEAERLFQEGRSAARDYDWSRALERYLEAYAELPGSRCRDTRSSVVTAIVGARLAMFEQDGRPSHLHDAQRLVDRNERRLPKGVVAGLSRRIDEQRAEIEPPKASGPAGPRLNEAPSRSRSDKPRKPGQSLIVSGSALAAVGLGLAIGGGVSIATKDSEQPTVMDLVSVTSGGAAALVGAVLVGLGAKKRKQNRHDVSVGASAAPTQAGVSIRGRF